MRPFLLCLALVLLVGCPRASEPDPLPPPTTLRIVSISPTGDIGFSGDAVQFVAVLEGVEGTPQYVWSIAPSISGSFDDPSAASPVLTLGHAGDCTLTLDVSDSATHESARQMVGLRIRAVTLPDPLRVTAVTLDPPAGLPLGTGSLTVYANDTFDEVEWDLAAGLLTSTADLTSPALAIEFQEAGSYTGQVRIHDADGWTEWYSFAYSVAVPVAPEWTQFELGPASLESATNGITMSSNEGKVALLYGGTGGLTFARALIADPQGITDFSQHVLDPGGLCAQGRNLLFVEGRWVSLYCTDSSNHKARIAISSSDEPVTTAGWEIYTLPYWVSNFQHSGSSLLSRPQGLAVAFNADFGAVNFGQANSSLPDGPEDWTFTYSGTGVLHPSLRECPEGPCFSAVALDCDFGRSRVILAQALVANPVQPADWHEETVELRGGCEGYPSDMAEWKDRLAIVYRSTSLGPQSPVLLSVTNPGLAIEDTSFTTFPLTPSGDTGFGGHIVVSRGRLAVLYVSNSSVQLTIARATGLDPSDPAQWERQGVTGGNPFGLFHSALVDLDGRLAIAWIDWDSSTIRLAISDGPF